MRTIYQFIQATENSVGTLVQLRERMNRGILTNKQEPKHRGIEWAPKQGSGEPLALSSWVWKSGADKVRAAWGKTEMEAPVSTINLRSERESWRKTRLESPAGRAWTSCRSASFPEPRNKKHCIVEPVEKRDVEDYCSNKALTYIKKSAAYFCPQGPVQVNL